jgi:predicted ATPase/DNA-binding SARP family transcriptional activator
VVGSGPDLAGAVPVRFAILGSFEVADDEGRPVAVGGLKRRAVLAILLMHANEVVSTDRLIEYLWAGEPPASATKSLQVHVSRLRGALGNKGVGEHRLVTLGAGYLLRVTPGELDAERFERLVDEADALSTADSAELAAVKWREALEMWRGEALSDFAYDSFAQPEIARLSELRVGALERRIAADMAVGRDAQVIAELERLVHEHPYREQLRAQLMLALYRTGRQAEALQAYQDTRAALVEELGIEPSAELRTLHEAVLAQDASLLGTSTRFADIRTGDSFAAAVALSPGATGNSSTNLTPQTRALVGREDERVRLGELLRGNRRSIVTVTGIGGIGKTRLTLAVGADLLDESPGGVFLVPLAGIHDPASILPMIADAAGIVGGTEASLESVLAQRLGEQPALLILDNFEQLLSGASIVAELAANAEHLRVVITSQVPLRIGAEQTFALEPLASADAAALFIERARARVGDFAPVDDEQEAIHDVCARLDCLPLAIELAAARVGVLGPHELAQRLERPLDMLTRGDRDAPERQRSLRASIDWTYALLTSEQQFLFGRLGVCAGTVSVDFVEALSAHGPGPETVDALDELLACSFVRRRDDQRLGIRFLLPQALRDYALERLVESAAESGVRRLHAEQVQRLARRARLWKWGASTHDRMALLAASAEIRPAVAWSRTHDPELHVRICAALSSYWTWRGVLAEVDDELRRARDSGAGSLADRAWLVTLLAKLAQLGGDHDGARELMTTAIAEWRAVDDEQERALGLGPLGWVVRWDDRYDEGIALAREGLKILRRSGESRLVLRGLVFLAQALADSGDFAGADGVLAEADALAAGDPTWELAPIHADCAELRGNHVAALSLYAESLAWSSTTGESHQMLMDMRALVSDLASLEAYESALEAYTLTRLEEQRTGRVRSTAAWDAELLEAAAAAREAVTPDAAAAAVSRATGVDAPQRASRAIELAEATVVWSREPGNAPVTTDRKP